MNRKEEYAIAVIILVALVTAIASMVTSDMNLGVGAIAIAIVAVLYSICVIHFEAKDQEAKQFAEQAASTEVKQPLPDAESEETPAVRKYNRHTAMKDSAKTAAPMAPQPAEEESSEPEEQPAPVKKTASRQPPAYDFDSEEPEDEAPKPKKAKPSRSALGTEDE